MPKRFFELWPDDRIGGNLEARHRWGLPGVRCTVCGVTWANTGIAYPTVDLSGLVNASEYERQWPVPWEVFEERRSQIVNLLPAGAPAPPGTELGPLIGKGAGTFGDFAWQGSWTVLMRDEALERLWNAKLSGPQRARAELTGRSVPKLIELQIEPQGCLSERCLSGRSDPPCAVCGRLAITRPAVVVLDASSVGPEIDVFRLRDLTTMIVVTDRVADRIDTLGLTGAVLREIPAE